MKIKQQNAGLSEKIELELKFKDKIKNRRLEIEWYIIVSGRI